MGEGQTTQIPPTLCLTSTLSLIVREYGRWWRGQLHRATWAPPWAYRFGSFGAQLRKAVHDCSVHAVGVAVNSAGIVVDTVTLGHFSEVGILILLFMAGLEVELEAFLQKWRTVTIIGVGQIVCSTSFFALTSIFVLPAIGARVNTNSAVYFGLCMCFSSTILVLGYLKNSKSMGTVYGQLCLGTLVLQDAASVLGIAVLSGLATGVGTCVQASNVDCGGAASYADCLSLGSGCSALNTTLGNASSTFLCTDVCNTVDLLGKHRWGRWATHVHLRFLGMRISRPRRWWCVD